MVITSRENPRIKQLKRLYSSRKFRKESGLFVVEGMRGCVDAVREFLDNKRIEIVSVYYVKDSLSAYNDLLGTDIFFRLPDDIRFEITAEIAEKISDTDSSQGVFAVVKMLDKKLDSSELRPDGKYLVLDNLQDPGNLGTMLRTADAVGVDGIILTENCVDLYNPKAVRSTVGSMFRINVFIEDNFESVAAAFEGCGVKIVAAVVNGGESISSYDFSGGCAVVIGNEGRGLPDDTVRRCTDKVSIEMKGNINSLNAATAGTIFLWEMTRGSR